MRLWNEDAREAASKTMSERMKGNTPANKLTIEAVQERVAAKHSNIIVTEYINQTKVHYHCTICDFNGSKTLTRLVNQGCSNCMKINKTPRENTWNKYNTEDYIKKLNNLSSEFEVVSDYINSSSKITIKHINCGNTFDVTAGMFLLRLRCPKCNKRTANNKIELNIDEVKRLYIDELKTLEDIASILGVYKSKVYSIIKDNNIKMTKEQKHMKYSNAGGRAEIFTKEELIDLYINKNNSLNDIITNYSITKKQLQRLLSLYNIRKPKELEVENRNKTMVERYGVTNAFSSEEIKSKISKTVKDRYGVDYFCLHQKAIEANKPYKVSKANKELSELLTSNNIENKLESHSFDIEILNKNIFVEINPSYTHNSTHPAFFKEGISREPISKDYHLNKSKKAEELGYRCIHIFDWDDKDKIINLLLPKTILYARNCDVREITLKEANDFLNLYHLQNGLVKQDICLGLFYKDNLIEVMTFGKPRYNKNYEYELLRLCTHKDYSITGGTQKLFKYFLDKYSPKSIISYCDKSKFNGDVYSKLGFTIKGEAKPSKHWYNMKTEQHITDSLLRQRGFDQLFGTNYGKGTSNEKLMIEHGFVEIYDCGQSTYVWTL